MKPMNMARDSMVSVQSESSTSDEEKRRSGSAERQQSPDHVVSGYDDCIHPTCTSEGYSWCGSFAEVHSKLSVCLN